jgi:hypothetical protein
MQNHVFAICHDFRRTAEIVDRLLAAGIVDAHISILTSEASGARLGVAPGVSARLGAGIRAGGLAGGLIDAGLSETQARFYAQEVAEKGAVLIGVQVAKTEHDLVRQILTPEQRRPGLLARA